MGIVIDCLAGNVVTSGLDSNPGPIVVAYALFLAVERSLVFSFCQVAKQYWD